MLPEIIVNKLSSSIRWLILLIYWMTGDCNTKLSPLDEQGRLTWKETKYRNSLLHFIKEIDLGVIYGEIHPKNKSYTYESMPLKLKSSIVFFSISGKYTPDIKDLKIQRRDGNENVA